MGFFDEIAKNEEERDGIEVLKKQAEELYKILIETDKKLERTANYSEAFTRVKKSAFEDFKSYFEAKRFTITPSKYSNLEGFTANAGEINAEFNYNGQNEFFFGMLPTWSEYLNLQDVEADVKNFRGYEYDGELNIRNIKQEDLTANDYNHALKDIQKDIDALSEKIQKQYTPKLEFYLHKRDVYVANLVEYLELLNRELKQPQ